MEIDDVISLLDKDSTDVISYFKQYSTKYSKNEDNFTFDELGIKFYCPSKTAFISCFNPKLLKSTSQNLDFEQKINSQSFANWLSVNGLSKNGRSETAINFAEKKEVSTDVVLSNSNIWIEMKYSFSKEIPATIINYLQIKQPRVEEFNVSEFKIYTQEYIEGAVVMADMSFIQFTSVYNTEELANAKKLSENDVQKYIQSLEKLKSSKDINTVLGAYYQLSSAYTSTKDYPNAIKNSKLLILNKNYTLNSSDILNLQELYLLNGNYDLAIKLHKDYFSKFKTSPSRVLLFFQSVLAKELQGLNTDADIEVLTKSLDYISFTDFNWSFGLLESNVSQNTKVSLDTKTKIQNLINQVKNAKIK